MPFGGVLSIIADYTLSPDFLWRFGCRCWSDWAGLCRHAVAGGGMRNRAVPYIHQGAQRTVFNVDLPLQQQQANCPPPPPPPPRHTHTLTHRGRYRETQRQTRTHTHTHTHGHTHTHTRAHTHIHTRTTTTTITTTHSTSPVPMHCADIIRPEERQRSNFLMSCLARAALRLG